MRSPICTIDASCVIALDYLGVLPNLNFLYSRVLLPKGVRAELFRRRAMKNRVRKILNLYAFVEACDGYDQTAVDMILIELRKKGLKDRGETEAVVQAAETGAEVLIDDRSGRDLAVRYDCECHGTLWVLRRFFELDLASSATTREYFVRLLGQGIRLPRKEVNQFLQEIGEPQIPGVNP